MRAPHAAADRAQRVFDRALVLRRQAILQQRFGFARRELEMIWLRRPGGR